MGLRDRTQKHVNRIRIGTVHTFQGGERDATVLSLVGSPNMPRGSIDWADHQHQIWNVAITCARSHLIATTSCGNAVEAWLPNYGELLTWLFRLRLPESTWT